MSDSIRPGGNDAMAANVGGRAGGDITYFRYSPSSPITAPLTPKTRLNATVHSPTHLCRSAVTMRVPRPQRTRGHHEPALNLRKMTSPLIVEKTSVSPKNPTSHRPQ